MLGFIDPISTGGRLFLLVVDKLFIGAILAGAFVVFDIWKTDDTREYNQIIQQRQDDFKRAEFTKELLPIALDGTQHISIRIEVLGSLIRTQSVYEDSAFDIALSILREGKLAREGSLLSDSQLVTSFARMLSPIIPDILPQIVEAYGKYSSGENAPVGYRHALIYTFEYAWRNYADEELRVLDDKSFVAENLDQLWAITPQRHIQYKFWTDTSLIALEIFRDIEILKNRLEEEESVALARSRLSALLDSKLTDVGSTNLSTALFSALHASDDTRFLEAGFSTMSRLDGTFDNSGMDLREGHDPSYDQFGAAMDYVIRASATNSAAEQYARPIVRDFLDVLRTKTISRGNYPMQRTAVCVLVRSMSNAGPDSKRSRQADQLLFNLWELPAQTLRDANVGFLVEWGKVGGKRRAMEYCTKSLSL